MENPFEIIIEKLNVIEKRMHSIEIKLNGLENANYLMDTKQVSEYLKLAVPTIYDKVHKREIPHHKVSSKLYFSKTEIDNWVLENKILTKTEIHKMTNDYCLNNRF